MLRYKIARFIPFFIVIIYCIIWLIVSAVDRRENIPLNLNTTVDSTNILESKTLQNYGNIEVRGVTHKEVVIHKPTFLINFLAPDSLYFFDNIKLFFVAIAGIIFVITFWDFSYQRPFTKQTTLGMRLLTITMFVYMFFIIMRTYWLNNYLAKHTGQNFSIESNNIIFSAEFLLAALFLRVTKIFKKGTALQQEQDLTV